MKHSFEYRLHTADAAHLHDHRDTRVEAEEYENLFIEAFPISFKTGPLQIDEETP